MWLPGREKSGWHPPLGTSQPDLDSPTCRVPSRQQGSVSFQKKKLQFSIPLVSSALLIRAINSTSFFSCLFRIHPWLIIECNCRDVWNPVGILPLAPFDQTWTAPNVEFLQGGMVQHAFRQRYQVSATDDVKFLKGNKLSQPFRQYIQAFAIPQRYYFESGKVLHAFGKKCNYGTISNDKFF